MKTLFRFITKLFSAFTPRDPDQAYLARSVDVYDLERRIRQLDSRPYDAARHGGSYGLFMR